MAGISRSCGPCSGIYRKVIKIPDAIHQRLLHILPEVCSNKFLIEFNFNSRIPFRWKEVTKAGGKPVVNAFVRFIECHAHRRQALLKGVPYEVTAGNFP